ncbi:hypothetical protein CKAH01_15576 [Colletotrichum kahawae]|uniref:DUF7580 domain-containing protein n=1 Tax=Colletotrichum kahawae TaxID=34407 RepID=A0AAD9YK34_COLKA|nr:hypothetical protein CKAH01_15576 [Colletotrichum kahawae]
MAELALGVVGVVPLIGGAIKAYKEVNTKLKLFCQSSKQIKRMHQRLKTHRQVFANECRLWLAFVIDDDVLASEMASDSEHDGWNDTGLDASFRSQLKDNYDVWLEINTEICQKIDSLETSLANFAETSDAKTQDSKLKKVLKKAVDGVKVATNATDINILIEKLRLSNNELKGLREQVGEIRKTKPRSAAKVASTQKGDWASLVKIRRASKALYEALIRTWKCSQPGHLAHAVKLFVETKKVDGEVQMNMAIMCQNQTRDLVQSMVVQLEVRSQNLEWIEQPKLPRELPPPDDHQVAPRKRLKVVRFAETTVQTHSSGCASTTTVAVEQSPNRGSSDLRSSTDICKELMRRLSTDCLGHLDSQSDEPFRHSFYPAKKDFCGDALQSSYPDPKAINMDEVLDDSSKAFFSTVDRLRLARSLVSAVLKFHSTPWLSDFWRLRDLAFFQTDHDEDISEALRTMHLGVEVSQTQLNSMEDVQISPECSSFSQVSEDDRLFCGINNLTLHSLGVALLQIDRWAQVEPSDILNVRKMALRNSSLGPRYQEITQKCLRCDFGYGSDLTKPRLQEAVYENVVGALEKKISSLDLNED